MTTRLYLLFFTALLVIGGGCKSMDYELKEPETRTWPANGITQINALTENGDITLSAIQDTMITAEITKRCMGEDSTDAAAHIDNIEISDSTSGGQLTLEADMPDDDDERNYRADFDMSAPQSIHINLATVNGTILIEDMIAGANIAVTNGSITTNNLQGGINGAIVDGAIDCDMALLAANESALLAATNGDITLFLPSDVSAEFDAETVNGTVTVEGFPSVNYTIDESNHRAGTIGAGDAKIYISVVNGDITIRAR